MPSAPVIGDATTIVHAEAGAIEAGDDFVDDIDAHVDVAHDATLAEARPPGFVLRLDEQHERRIRGGERREDAARPFATR